ncbi:hypothetical protein [Flavilitoribacter nigricans]|uniref:Uncharacterized protein n=1 Tax=Flavilitoribacter nigricans (strain ATCC 23147 / DSM 23189 / NBRC 102662 / NCIMB 1420 / SS-2) TaxID=1122177 RepID=A0A2D0MYR4_FLAN2|nr:hypothetical protein [Flavilitoribacter nigricans]PHN01029.1 hypothetical protein CRP01_39175 [Flavilitoribacter nigricans DSM 23189 = NBRC 102662]
MNEKRRQFLRNSGVVTTGLSLFPRLGWADPAASAPRKTKEVIKMLTVINDEKVPGLLEKQIDQPGDRWHGGLKNVYELPNEHSTTSFMVVLGGAYASPSSQYYRSAELEQPLERAIECLLRVQHEDGTIDLYSTNFHSTPDTAFIVNYLSPVYACLKRMERPGLRGFIGKLENFFQNAAECLRSGGIHTANHRWVVSSALARVFSFFPDARLVDRVNAWLGEGIDMDPDGQYTERSVSIYSPICNTMFLTIGRLLDRPELMDVVRRNLSMSLYYIHPDGEVLTDASDRQDRAYTGYVKEYYYAYRYFAIVDQDPQFAAVCELIEEKMPERITHFLPALLELPIFEKKMPTAGRIPDQYVRRFSHSGILRIRRGDTDISVIERNPTFLAYRKGSAVLQSMRLGAAFFGKGQFESQEAVFDTKSVTFKWSASGPYYQPIAPEIRTGENDWETYSRDARGQSEIQYQEMTVTITENEGRVEVEAEITGTKHVPVAWELSFRKGGTLSGVTEDPQVADAYFLESGEGSYQLGEHTIRFGPGAVTHKWSQMRGTLPKQEGYSVYITGYTPFKHKIYLE